MLAENIRSLHNVGAIFRNADAAGWDEVWLIGYTGTPPDRRIEKVSLGAENFTPWRHFSTFLDAFEVAKQENVALWGLELTENAKNIFEIQQNTLPERLGLVLGNEVTGIVPETLEQLENVVKIPMNGEKASLNVSVACGIALYALKQTNQTRF